MIQRERNDAETPRPAAPAPAVESDLGAARAAGTRLLAAASEAITAALSSNSAQFLSAIRQHGGQ